MPVAAGEHLQRLGVSQKISNPEPRVVHHGNDGNEQVYGEFGVDQLYGCAGNDLIDRRQGADFILVSAGDETYYVDHSGDVINDQGLATIT